MTTTDTTIKISNEMKSILDNFKIHHRETYEDVLRRLIMEDKDEKDTKTIL